MITRIKKTLTAIPASLSEAVTYLVSIGNKQRSINRIKREAKVKVEKINKETKETVETLTKERDAFFTALFAFASPRKAELTAVTRSQKTAAGTFGWRWTPPYVELAEGKSDQEIISAMKKKGLGDYIRVIEEIDREALLLDRPIVPGVSYVNHDEFFAKPKLTKADGRAEELSKITDAIDI